jgi:hypothetical protein
MKASWICLIISGALFQVSAAEYEVHGQIEQTCYNGADGVR